MIQYLGMKNVSHTTRALFFASCVAIVLDIARVGLSQKINFIFLIWNLTLAWIPYIISSSITKKTSKGNFAFLFVPWLLFFPNAVYLVTDILHVDFRPPIPLWYDSVIFFIFAWLGATLAALSLIRVHYYVEHHFGEIKSRFFVVAIAVVSAFGIYLGRFERWNSWDAITNPFEIIKDIFVIYGKIPHTKEPILFVLVFSAVILSTYYVIRDIIKDEDLEKLK